MAGLEGVPVLPQAAATLVLLRDGPSGLETFIMVRTKTMAFGAGAAVFPGGKLDPSDGDINSENPLEAYKMAALRESFEEAGVLFATRCGQPLNAKEAADFAPWRSRIAQRETSFGDFCAHNDLQADTDALHLIARWVTPKHMKKRFDTYFFLAVATENHEFMHDGNEAVASQWCAPQAILDRHETGALHLMPPTYWTMQDLAGYKNTASTIVGLARESVDLVEPAFNKSGDRTIIEVPGRVPIIVGNK